MRLGNLKDLRIALGGVHDDGIKKGNPRVGVTYAVALKKAAGCGGTRLFDIETVVAWKVGHPEWKSTDVYKPSNQSRPGNHSNRSASTAGKSDAPS